MYNIEFTSHPAYNGYTGKKAITNPNSRLVRMLVFLTGGKATKRAIMWSVFGKVLREDIHPSLLPEVVGHGNVVTNRGNNSYLYSQALKEGFVEKSRVGNTVFYSLTEKGAKVVANILWSGI